MRQSDMARHPVSSAAESAASLPRAQGLYDPRFEHDACGIGMIVQTDGEKSHVLVDQAINMLERMAHRGGVGNEADTGDGAGILLQIPHMFLAKAAAYSGFELPEAGDYGVAMLFTSPDEKRRTTVSAAFAAWRRQTALLYWVCGLFRSTARCPAGRLPPSALGSPRCFSLGPREPARRHSNGSFIS